jgi:peptide/nickel transport system ATP-binding protein
VRAVDGVSLSLERGETLGVVGESGCGKSVTALSVMRLVPAATGRIVAGSIRFEGTELLSLPPRSMRAIRGNRISMIFQEPMSSLNPVMTVGRQIAETVAMHQGLSRRAALDRAVEMLALVRIPEPRRRAGEFPHQLSGGMRQRVMIAIAMACTPTILIADEPTTALDVTIQAQILDLMLEMKERTGAAVMLITHDLGVIAETAQRVIVMYAGRKVEEAPVDALFAHPRHPYTRGLMTSIPRLNRAAAESTSLSTSLSTMQPLSTHRAGSRRSRVSCRRSSAWPKGARSRRAAPMRASSAAPPFRPSARPRRATPSRAGTPDERSPKLAALATPTGGPSVARGGPSHR